MLRDKWQFEYAAHQLTEATQDKLAFHDAQLEFWQAKRTEVMAAIEGGGIEVSEKIALSFAHPKARDFERGGEITVRADLRKALTETFDKLKYHTKKRDTYAGWEQILAANPASILPLAIDDWLFFFGRDITTENDRDY